MLENWLDNDGLMHTEFNPTVDQSENSPMFTGLLSITEGNAFRHHDKKLRISAIIEKWDGKFRANSNREWGSHFSHDNMTGLYCLVKNNEWNTMIKRLPIAKWNGEWWLHPRDLAFYFWCHYPRLGLLTLWIASLAMIVSCIQEYKVRDGKKIIKTDGKLLAYMRCNSFNLNITFAICSFFIRRHKYFSSWNDVAKKYFQVKGHPLRSLIK